MRLDCVNGGDIFIHSFHFISRFLSAERTTTLSLKLSCAKKKVNTNFHHSFLDRHTEVSEKKEARHFSKKKFFYGNTTIDIDDKHNKQES